MQGVAVLVAQQYVPGMMAKTTEQARQPAEPNPFLRNLIQGVVQKKRARRIFEAVLK